MLDRKGKVLDLHTVLIPDQSIEIDRQGMRRQLRVQACTQAPKTMRMVRADPELLSQLAIDSFNHLPVCVVAAGHLGW